MWPLDELGREHAAAAVGPDDPGDDDVGVARQHARQLVRVATLEPVVELTADRLRELLHDGHGIEEQTLRRVVGEKMGDLHEEVEVGLDLSRGRGPLHLHGHDLPGRQDGAMHLADAGRGQRLFVEAQEEPPDRQAELVADDLVDL